MFRFGRGNWSDRSFGHMRPGVYFETEPGSGEPGSGEPGAGAGAGGGGGGGGGGGADDNALAFSQNDLNRHMKREREAQEKKFQGQIRQQLDEVNEFKKQKGLSEEARQTLSNRAESLSAELMTATEKAASEKVALEKKHTVAVESLTTERDSWRSQYEREKVETAVLSAATKHGAFQPTQLMGLVSPLCSVLAVEDGDGNPTGSYVVRVKTIVTAEGKAPEEKFVTVDEHIAAMKEAPESINLFVANKPGGSGYRPTQASGTAGKNLSSTGKIGAGMRERRG